MPLARLAGVTERAVGIELTGQHFASVEQDLVILGPEAHRVVTGLIHPVAEVEDAFLERFFECFRKGRVRPVPVHCTQQSHKIKVAAVPALVDTLDGFHNHVILDAAPAPHSHLGDLAVDAALAAGGVFQRLNASLGVSAIGSVGVLVAH